MTETARRGTVAALLALAVLCPTRPASAAQTPRQATPAVARQTEPAAVPQAGPAAAPRSALPSQQAEEIRALLNNVLARYSPSVGRVLALDPSLLAQQGYLDPYPELAAFLREHPEIARDPSYYFRGRDNDSGYYVPDRETRMLRMWGSFFGGAAALLVFCVVTGALVWLIKTLVDYRRWSRLSKVQTEAHNKLLDRFGANEDLLAYIATPAGKRFLESAPIMLDPTASSGGGPLRRILWAVEIGLVVACGGGGFLIARQYVPLEVGQVLSVAAVFAIALGVGFVLAAAASYLLSWRLGILRAAPSRNGRDVDAHTAS